MINSRKLKDMAMAADCWKLQDQIITDDLKQVADIGCRGKFWQQSHSKNVESAFKFPQEIADAIAAWITKRFAKGPFDKPEPVLVVLKKMKKFNFLKV